MIATSEHRQIFSSIERSRCEMHIRLSSESSFAVRSVVGGDNEASRTKLPHEVGHRIEHESIRRDSSILEKVCPSNVDANTSAQTAIRDVAEEIVHAIENRRFEA